MLAQPIINHSFESLMNTKDQSNQNPENVNPDQEENSLPVEETVEIIKNTENQAEVSVDDSGSAHSEEIPEAEIEMPATAEPDSADDQVSVKDEELTAEVTETTKESEQNEQISVEEPEVVAEEIAASIEPDQGENIAPVVDEQTATADEPVTLPDVVAEESITAVVDEQVESIAPVAEALSVTADEPVTLPEIVAEEPITAVVDEQVESTAPVAEALSVTTDKPVALPEIVAEESITAVVDEQFESIAPVADDLSVTDAQPVAEPAVVVEETTSAAGDDQAVTIAPVEGEVLLLPEDAVEDDETDEIEVNEQEKEAIPLFENLDREQLVGKLEELVTDSNVNAIKSAVGLIRLAFLKLNKDYKQELYQKLAEVADDTDAETAPDAQPMQDDAIEERFKTAFNIYKQNKGKYIEEQEKLKIKNLEAKNQILDELRLLINSEETLKKTYDEFKILQERWKTIGMVPKGDINTLWQNYHFLVEKFFDKVKINKELKDLDLKKNLEAKIHLCEKTEELLLEPSIIKSFKNLQQYHEEWKEIGPVPQDKKDELWDRFRSATEKINERRREYYNEMQESLEQNYTAKVILCEKAEQLMATESDSIKAWQDVTAQFTELLKIWKTIGPAPKKQNNEIWARFKASLDGFFNAKKEYFNKLKEQQMNNFNLKLDLCVQAEALRNSTDWKNTSRELINMQNEWKKIGPVPRKQSDRIWKRFRAACDEFFSSKSEYFKNVSGHEEENMKLKLDLIEKVKEFSVGDDRNLAIETLKDYQRQWMEIGHVPIKEKDRLQTDFRALVNKHFEKLKIDSATMGAMNYRNRVDRMTKDAPDAGRIISKERSFVQGKIQQLQDEIKTWENNIGFFAKSKTANLLKQEFEKKIDKAKEELQLLEAKLKMLRETNQ
jgi:hypothetical protein